MTSRAVKGYKSELSRGQCFGLSVDPRGAPRACSFSSKSADLVRAVVTSIAAKYPGFCFTSMQVVLNARALLHVDKGNCGPSLTLALGPYQGGQLAVLEEDATGHTLLSGGEWHLFDGRNPHFVLPYSGDRAAIVLYCHCAAFSAQATHMKDQLRKQGFPLPENFGAAIALPQAKSRTEVLIQRSARIYGQECDELMHYATTIQASAARAGSVDSNRTRSWGIS